MISTDTLTDIYNRWADKENLQPLGCALEEQMFNDKLSDCQRNWLRKFSKVWEYAQDKEYQQWEKRKVIGEKTA